MKELSDKSLVFFLFLFLLPLLFASHLRACHIVNVLCSSSWHIFHQMFQQNSNMIHSLAVMLIKIPITPTYIDIYECFSLKIRKKLIERHNIAEEDEVLFTNTQNISKRKNLFIIIALATITVIFMNN